MAHTAETITTYGDFLKYKYEDKIIQTTPEYIALMQRIPLITRPVGYGGKSITFPVLYNSMGSVASVGEGDVLPFSLPGNYDNTVIGIYHHYFGCSVSGVLIRNSADREGAFARAWAQDIAIKQRSYRQHLNRQLCGDGLARLAQQDGAVAGQVITVDNMGGWSGQRASAVNGATFLTANQYIQVRDSSGTAENGALKITSVSTSGAFPSTSAAITVTGTCSSCADGSYIHACAGTDEVDGYGNELSGIKVLVDDGTVAATVQSIATSGNPEWKSHVGYGATAGTAEPITPTRMMTLLSKIQVAGGGKVDNIFTSPGVFLAYGALADSNNLVTNAQTYDVGYSTLAFNTVPIFQDPYMADEMYFVDNRALMMFQTGPAGWVDTGQIISQVKGASAAYDQMEAYWVWDMSLGITNRQWCGKLTDITVNDDWALL